MYPAADFLSQLTHDRQQDRLAAAAVHRLRLLVAQEEHPRKRMLLARRPVKGSANGPTCSASSAS